MKRMARPELVHAWSSPRISSRRPRSILIQLKVADFLIKPLQTSDFVRSCNNALEAAGRGDPGRAAIPVLHAGVRRCRHDVDGARNRPDPQPLRQEGRPNHLHRRPQFPAWFLRRISRYRAAFRYQGDRELARASRPPIAGRHAVAPFDRPVADRRAYPAERNALVQNGVRRAPARPGVGLFRQCRHRHAAHLVPVDRDRDHGLEPAVRRLRHDRAVDPSCPAAARSHRPKIGKQVTSACWSIAWSARQHRSGLKCPTSRPPSASISPAVSRTITRLVRDAVDHGVPLEEIEAGQQRHRGPRATIIAPGREAENGKARSGGLLGSAAACCAAPAGVRNTPSAASPHCMQLKTKSTSSPRSAAGAGLAAPCCGATAKGTAAAPKPSRPSRRLARKDARR